MNNPIKKNKFLFTATPLLLIIFIDTMGLGLLFPIINELIMDPHSSFFSTALSTSARNLCYGITIAIYMICWFFGSSLLGELSDQMGRRKSLLICLLGAFGGYLLSAIAVVLHSLWFLIIGRIIAGFTSGSQPIAQAAIVDISEPEHKARNLGFTLLSMSLGFIFGPILGGVFSDPTIIPGATFATPLYFASAFALINAILLWSLFKETYPRSGKLSLRIQRAITIFISAFTHLKVKKLSFIYLIMISGWSSFYSFLPLFLLRIYNFSPLKISLFTGVMGIGFSIGNGFLVDLCTKHFTLKNIVIYSLVITAICAFIIVIAPYKIVSWLMIAPLGAAVSLAYAALLTLFSNQVDADSQGWIMGITGAIMALVWGIDGLVVALLANFSAKLPIILSVIGLSAAAFITRFWYKNNSN